MYANPKFVFEPEDGELIARFTVYLMRVIEHANANYFQRYLNKGARRDWEILVDRLPEPPTDSYREAHWLNGISEEQFDFEEERISQAFYKLPLLRQTILELSFIQEMPVREIAEKLNCSVKFVYNQKHRALKKLRDILLGGGDD